MAKTKEKLMAPHMAAKFAARGSEEYLPSKLRARPVIEVTEEERRADVLERLGLSEADFETLCDTWDADPRPKERIMGRIVQGLGLTVKPLTQQNVLNTLYQKRVLTEAAAAWLMGKLNGD